jgi:hypothetical protein
VVHIYNGGITPNRRSHVHGITMLAALVALLASPFTLPATAVLKSSALRVEVTAAPYSYTIIDSSTGNALVQQSQTPLRLAVG